LQHGGAVEAARALRHRKQPICDGHQRQPRVSGGPAVQAGRELPRAGHPGRRDGRARGARRGDDGARMDPRGQGACVARDEDVPVPRPFDERPGEIPFARRGAGGARQERPDRGVQAGAGDARRRRGRVQGDRRGNQEAGRRGGGLRRAVARAARGGTIYRRAGGAVL
ncbi:MAG: Pyruvate dehydrogenase E1 component alpha subunit, partial [uncultured Sphingomonadaceae bacterium]